MHPRQQTPSPTLRFSLECTYNYVLKLFLQEHFARNPNGINGRVPVRAGWALNCALLHCTARLKVCVFVAPPPVAVTVSVEVFTAAVDATFRVRVLLPFPGEAMLVGAKLAVTPAGSPLTESASAALNPLTAAPVTMMGVDPPRATVTLAPLSPSVNIGPITVRLSVCVLVNPPPVAVTMGE